ncbi:MAG: complex I subunit 1 family protein [Acidobacteriota bacterium]
MDFLTELGIALAKVVFLFSAIMGMAALLTWQERKQSAVMQDRIGANRADIFGFRAIGLFQIMADGIKMFFKQDFVPRDADRFIFTLAPMAALFFALMAFAAVPFGGVYQFGEYRVSLQIFETHAGLLLIFAMMSLGIYGVVLGGYASSNNYATLGGLRGASQMISYEITMGVSVVGIIMVYGTIELQEMVAMQGELLFGWIPMWGILMQPLGCLLFLIAAMAETKRVPFDIPEGESEIVGYFIEYSGMRFGMFFFTDFIETILAGALTATLFFGGWQVPWLYSGGFHFPWGWDLALPTAVVMLLQVGAFFIKTFLIYSFLLFVRWTLPRFRWDQLIRLGWIIMLPLSLINIIITGLILLLI